MHRFISFATVLMVTWALSTALVAQKSTFTAADLDKLMKKDGPALAALVRAVTSGNHTEARAQVALLKSALTESQQFWVSNKRPDAIQFGKTVLGKLDDLDTVVGNPQVDQAVALGAVRTLTAACNDCHKVYRVTGDDGQFTLKPGSVPGL